MELLVHKSNYKTVLERNGLTSIKCLSCKKKAPIGVEIKHPKRCPEYGTPQVPIKY